MESESVYITPKNLKFANYNVEKVITVKNKRDVPLKYEVVVSKAPSEKIRIDGSGLSGVVEAGGELKFSLSLSNTNRFTRPIIFRFYGMDGVLVDVQKVFYNYEGENIEVTTDEQIIKDEQTDEPADEETAINNYDNASSIGIKMKKIVFELNSLLSNKNMIIYIVMFFFVMTLTLLTVQFIIIHNRNKRIQNEGLMSPIQRSISCIRLFLRNLLVRLLNQF